MILRALALAIVAVLALAWPAHANNAYDQAANSLLIDRVPPGYRLTGPSEGLTGPVTPEKLSQWGLTQQEVKNFNKLVSGSGMKAWVTVDGRVLVVSAFRAKNDVTASAMQLELITAGEVTARSPLELPGITDGRGFVGQTRVAGMTLAQHTAVFRSGPWVFMLASLGSEPGPDPAVLVSLAQEQHARAPDGTTAPLDPAVVNSVLVFGELVKRVVLGVVILAAAGLVVFLILRRGQSRSVHPAPSAIPATLMAGPRPPLPGADPLSTVSHAARY